jgi:1,4-alpha-glucan branching enzyme
MKKKIVILIGLVAFLACKTEEKKETKNIVAISSEILESAVIYEANIRQYSNEGTFDAFTKDIPQLKELGVKIIWLMPVFPISQTKRKATGGDFASKIENPKERAKALGSYYAVSDFKKINPEFGTIEDFRELVKAAHENGMYVILDWVPNHTGWDHTWLKNNPEFYTKNTKGEITDPLNKDGTPVGWADVADLNYDSKELRTEMTNDMLYWLQHEDVDGFRCDVAGSVPTDFWQEAIPKLRAQKDIFMLAEAWEPELLKEELFDMAYGWDIHHTLNEMAKGENAPEKWDKNYAKDSARYESNDILMTFVTNHDENSWSGTIKERMGDASEVLTVLSYMTPGMPLIYSGQEYGLNHRLKFFEKDVIPHDKDKEWNLLKSLGELKKTNVALHGGKNAAEYLRLNTRKEILTFVRKKGNDEVVFVANLSNESIKGVFGVEGVYRNYFTGEKIKFSNSEALGLDAWEYKVLIK